MLISQWPVSLHMMMMDNEAEAVMLFRTSLQAF